MRATANAMRPGATELRQDRMRGWLARVKYAACPSPFEIHDQENAPTHRCIAPHRTRAELVYLRHFFVQNCRAAIKVRETGADIFSASQVWPAHKRLTVAAPLFSSPANPRAISPYSGIISAARFRDYSVTAGKFVPHLR